MKFEKWNDSFKSQFRGTEKIMNILWKTKKHLFVAYIFYTYTCNHFIGLKATPILIIYLANFAPNCFHCDL